jgi:antirestriction protein ArdC
MLSIQEKVTAQIIELLKSGNKPWIRPGMKGLPSNFVSQNCYPPCRKTSPFMAGI